jgi:hypothetical protein
MAATAKTISIAKQTTRPQESASRRPPENTSAKSKS